MSDVHSSITLPDSRTQAFFALLRAGLWGAEKELEGFQKLAATEWEAVYAMARQQTVRGLEYVCCPTN